MQWNEGHTWTLDVQLPVGAVNFKIVMHDPPNSNVRWELGEDRSVLIPETTTVSGAPVGQVRVLMSLLGLQAAAAMPPSTQPREQHASG